MNKISVFPLTLEEKLLYTNYTQLYIIIIMVQFYPWIILVSFVSYSLSYIFIPKNTGKKCKLKYKAKNKNTVHVWPKEKKWSLAHSKLHWVTVCPKKIWTLCWILPFAPPATGTYPSPSGMPFNIVIKEDHCQPY